MILKTLVATFIYEFGFEYVLIWKKYISKKSSTAPIWKYTSHIYKKMHFVPNFRKKSASRTPNKSEKIIHFLKIL